MDCKATILFCLAVLLTLLVANTESRNKKVVIHVPYKVKKMRHTHTVYKTVHHHHKYDHVPASSDEHEHFHHIYSHEDPPISMHSQQYGYGIPDFLPDASSIEDSYEMPDVPPHEFMGLPPRHYSKYSSLPLYRRD